MKTLILMASPRAQGRCAAWADELAASCREAGGTVQVLSAAGLAVAGCRACDACGKPPHRCIIRDDMDRVNRALASCDELLVVSPVYFSGPPSQLKALLDRLQPHFWAGTRRQPKRPARLFAVGDGGDPHGYQPLTTIVRSALAVAGFSLRDVQARIGASQGEGNNR